MDHLIGILVPELCQFFGNDHRRIAHAVLVLHETLARLAEPAYAGCDPEIAIAAALFHDLGIKPAEARFGYNDGPLQEEYGPPEARRLLSAVGFPPDKTEVVAAIIGTHHSPSCLPHPELALLKAADQAVNRRAAAGG